MPYTRERHKQVKPYNDKMRGTGRSTGLILIALGTASLKPGKWIEFKDHQKHGRDGAMMWRERIYDIAGCLYLCVRVKTEKSRVFVKSLMKPASTIL
jgi:hypothetical protein